MRTRKRMQINRKNNIRMEMIMHIKDMIIMITIIMIMITPMTITIITIIIMHMMKIKLKELMSCERVIL